MIAPGWKLARPASWLSEDQTAWPDCSAAAFRTIPAVVASPLFAFRSSLSPARESSFAAGVDPGEHRQAVAFRVVEPHLAEALILIVEGEAHDNSTRTQPLSLAVDVCNLKNETDLGAARARCSSI